MRTLDSLSKAERTVLEELRSRIRREFPSWNFRMTLFGSRARGDAEPDSDMDVMLEVETAHISFAEKQRLNRIAGEISMEIGLILSLFVVDQHLRRERGDYSIFLNIRGEGIPV
jgi:predicted nucleotidyltransferase